MKVCRFCGECGPLWVEDEYLEYPVCYKCARIFLGYPMFGGKRVDLLKKGVREEFEELRNLFNAIDPIYGYEEDGYYGDVARIQIKMRGCNSELALKTLLIETLQDWEPEAHDWGVTVREKIPKLAYHIWTRVLKRKPVFDRAYTWELSGPPHAWNSMVFRYPDMSPKVTRKFGEECASRDGRIGYDWRLWKKSGGFPMEYNGTRCKQCPHFGNDCIETITVETYNGTFEVTDKGSIQNLIRLWKQLNQDLNKEPQDVLVYLVGKGEG